MSKNSTKMGGKVFFSNILNAVGAGVVIALLPNALLGELLKFLKMVMSFWKLSFVLSQLYSLLWLS